MPRMLAASSDIMSVHSLRTRVSTHTHDSLARLTHRTGPYAASTHTFFRSDPE